MEDPHLWDDPEEAQKKTKLLASLKEDVHGYDALVSSRDDIRDMIEMADEEPDPALVPEVQEMFDDFKARFEKIRMKTLLSGEYDNCNAIVTLHAGTGGTEAMDWTNMLYRCIPVGAKRTALMSKSSIFWKEMRPVSNP